MKYFIFLFIIFINTNISFGKDYVLNFEESCFESYGEKQRDEIINSAIENWNNIESSPLIVIRGDDIEIEVDELNYTDYIWDPTGIPFSGTDIFNVPDYNLNPVICDSTGDLILQMNADSINFNAPAGIHGFTSREFLPYYDFFYIYISENHGLRVQDISDFNLTNGEDLIIEGGRFSVNQMISLLSHEIGHALGLGHVNIDRTTEEPFLIRPDNDYPIMWHNNLNSTTVLENEDIDEFHRVNSFSYLGKDKEVSFEAKITQSNQNIFMKDGFFTIADQERTKILLKINIPPEFRGQELEYVVAAKIQSTGIWYTYSKIFGWKIWDSSQISDLASNRMISSIEEVITVYDRLWGLNQDIELYFGLRVENNFFFNRSIPMIIKSTL